MHRDYTRQPHAKARTLSRRMARRMRSAEQFLAFAFPASLSAFTPAQDA